MKSPKDKLIRSMLRFIRECQWSHYAHLGARLAYPKFKKRAMKLAVK